jgi:hypothetical protein
VNDAVEGAVRGVVGSLAMTGMRQFAADLGLIEKTPPEELADKPADGVIAKVPQDKRKAAVLGIHCAVGAAGGVTYGVLPDFVRQKAWSGPFWGLAIWAVYEGGVAQVLGLKHAYDFPARERATIVADHLLYGYVLAQTQKRPNY